MRRLNNTIIGELRQDVFQNGAPKYPIMHVHFIFPPSAAFVKHVDFKLSFGNPKDITLFSDLSTKSGKTTVS